MYLSEICGKGGIYAKCVVASIANGVPIYTLEIRAPKFLDAEFEKHRMLSSNSSSSRAIPLIKSLEAVLEDPYIPFDLRKNQAGMQGYDYPDKEDVIEFLMNLREIADDISTILERYKDDIHKQHLTRYLEPFLFQTKVVTATEWDNFFNLRLDPVAQPEIQELARCMKQAIIAVQPVPLNKGEWHLPYIKPHERDSENAVEASVARCARVSYNNMDSTKAQIENDVILHDKLLSSKHFSCFEHQATPMEITQRDGLYVYYKYLKDGITHVDGSGRYWSGNFRGWRQYRQLVQTWNN